MKTEGVLRKEGKELTFEIGKKTNVNYCTHK